MGGRAFYPEDRDGRLLQNVDKQLKDNKHSITCQKSVISMVTRGIALYLTYLT
jgi:hypothetical protein